MTSSRPSHEALRDALSRRYATRTAPIGFYPLPSTEVAVGAFEQRWSAYRPEVTRRGLVYVHVPFCRQRCQFCRFFPGGHSDRRAEQFLDAARREIEVWADRRRSDPSTGPIEAVFVGGGTPSALTPDQMCTLLGAVRQAFDVPGGAEITMEWYPKDAEAEKLAAAAECGVNRISIGLQSWSAEILSALGAHHTPAQGEALIDAVAAAGFDAVNIDVMATVAKDGLEPHIADLRRAIAANPAMISVNLLELAGGSPLARRWVAPADGEKRRWLARAAAELAERGYAHQRVRNFYRDGKLHAYNRTTVGVSFDIVPIGPGAYGFVGGWPVINAISFEDWRERVASGHDAVAGCAPPSDDEMRRAFVVNSLLELSIDTADYHCLFGTRLTDDFPSLEQLIAEGVFERGRDDVFALHSVAREYADDVSSEVFSSFQSAAFDAHLNVGRSRSRSQYFPLTEPPATRPGETGAVIEMTEALTEALHLFTPVDRSVFDALGPNERRRHAADLAKRLAVGGELSRPGRGGDQVRALLSGSACDAFAAELDALVEFGTPLAELSPEEAAQARRDQVREEVLHFDRIMDLESLATGRRLKRRREFLWDAGPLAAAERLLTLLHERRVERGRDRSAWYDLGAQPSASVEVRSGSLVTMARNHRLPMICIARGAGAGDAAKELERYALRHPLGNALGLLDYSLFLDARGPVELVAAASAQSFDASWCDIWAAMPAYYMVFQRDGYRHRLREAATLEGRALGELTTVYAHRRITLSQGEQLVLMPRTSGVPDELSDLEAKANLPNNAGRIYLREAIQRAFPHSTPVFLAGRAGSTWSRADKRGASEGDERFMEALVSRMATTLEGRIHFSLEAGHIHSDRAVGAAQRRGLELGALLRRMLEDQFGARLHLELTPMVDDDHVVNRISYRDYRRLLAEHGIPADDLILESSPLISSIALDLLRRAIRLDGTTFRLDVIGDNLYLVADGLRLELVQDRNSLRLGCVLFDTALAIYRADRAAMKRLFFEEASAGRDVHREMTEAYDATPNPAEREKVREAFDRLWRTSWPHVQETVDQTPYLDRYEAVLSARRAAGESTIVLNILEDYYEPLERKVLRLAELLGIDLPMDAVLFAPYGVGLRQLQGGAA